MPSQLYGTKPTLPYHLTFAKQVSMHQNRDEHGSAKNIVFRYCFLPRFPDKSVSEFKLNLEGRIKFFRFFFIRRVLPTLQKPFKLVSFLLQIGVLTLFRNSIECEKKFIIVLSSAFAAGKNNNAVRFQR